MSAPWRGEACARIARAIGGSPGLEALAGRDTWPDVAAYDALFLDGTTRSVVGEDFHFELQEPRSRRGPRARATYDARIVSERLVPTRARSWHDLFNAVVWSMFPRAKLALHGHQLDAQRSRLRSEPQSLARSAAEDRLAMADEGGVVLAVSPRHLDALRTRLDDAPDALEDLVRDLDVAVHPFGHALLEHLLVAPRRVRAYPLVVATETPTRSSLDAQLAAHLAEVRSGPARKGVALALEDDGAPFTAPPRAAR